MFENIIVENLLTATNTFHFEDDGAINIYTRNCNGKHEPQQIEAVFALYVFTDGSARKIFAQTQRVLPEVSLQ